MLTLGLVTATNRRSDLLIDTVHSVLSQARRWTDSFALQYVVVDGSSPLLSSAEHAALTSVALPEWISFQYISESDGSLGEALAKGFGRLSADYYGFLNAGDMLSPMCLRSLATAVRSGRPDWICGLHVTYNDCGSLTRSRPVFRYRRDLISKGLYGRTVLPSIQQESTLWSDRLMKQVSLEELVPLRAAVDHFFWSRFSLLGSSPVAVDVHLGGFRTHGHHLGDSSQFQKELTQIYGRVRVSQRLRALPERLLWILHRLWRTLRPSNHRFESPMRGS
jgi:hypothetical protein